MDLFFILQSVYLFLSIHRKQDQLHEILELIEIVVELLAK